MPSDEFGERTEQPTERRRIEAREKGNVARSADLTVAGMSLAAAGLLFLLGDGLAGSLAGLLKASLTQPAWLQLDGPFAVDHAWGVMRIAAGSVLPLMLLMLAMAVFVNVVQFGFLVAPEALQPKFSRLNPLEGMKRIVSMRGMLKLAASLGKLTVLFVVAGWFIWGRLPGFLQLGSLEPQGIAAEIGRAVVMLAFLLALALFLLALLDFAFQRWRHEQDLRMSKQEVREELKQMEGDPLIRQRRREAHRKLAVARELQQVEHADVVVTSPSEIAVALKYDAETMPAPMVVAKGRGEIAARICRIAAEHGVPMIERQPLAQVLDRDATSGQPVPVDTYEVFAEIMAYVYRVTGRHKDRAA